MKLENNEICRIVDGDEIAFNRFMEHYSSRLYHYTFALLGQKESAEEIVSDVFFEVWKNRKSLAEIGNMNADNHLSKSDFFFAEGNWKV